MGFNKNRDEQQTRAATGNGGNSSNRGGNSERASGFLNFTLPSRTGGRKRLGSIPLYESKPAQAELVAWLKDNPEQATEVLLRNLHVDFRAVDAPEDDGFALE